jgi:hypothetical protein
MSDIGDNQPSQVFDDNAPGADKVISTPEDGVGEKGNALL